MLKQLQGESLIFWTDIAWIPGEGREQVDCSGQDVPGSYPTFSDPPRSFSLLILAM